MDTTFKYGRRTLDYCTDAYNHARHNERAVEVPVGLAFLRKHEKDTLEIGAVLPHYLPWDDPAYPRHTVVDLHEDFPGVLNVNALVWEPERQYKRVIAISTLEHFGGHRAFLTALDRLKSWTAPGGLLYVTIPAQCNETYWIKPAVIDSLSMDVRRFDKVRPQANGWAEVRPHNRRVQLGYGQPTPWANTVYLLEWKP